MAHNTARAPQPGTKPLRAAIYLRISKDEAGDTLGVRRQEKICRDLGDRLGWGVGQVFVDNDTSATRKGVKRPGYIALTKALRAGEVDGVLVVAQDRLVRRIRELEDLVDLLDEHAVPVESAHGGRIDLTSATGRGQARMAGVWASMEAEKMSERIRDKHAELAEKGLPQGGRRIYGYEADHVTPHPDEAPVVADMVRRLARGESLSSVARDLNEKGVTTSTGKQWSISQVKRIATNPRYIGRRTRGGRGTARVDVGKAVWPPLVDEATWRRANVLLTDPARADRRAPRKFLLSGGLIRCHCGGAMVGRTQTERSGKALIYQCRDPRRSPGPGAGCGSCGVRAERVDEIIVARAIELIEGPDLARARDARRAKGNAKLAANVARLRGELVEWDTMNDAGHLTPAQWLARTKSTQDRLDTALAALDGETTDAAVVEYVGRPGSLSAVWDDLTLDRRQAILRAVLDHVEIAPGGKGGRGFDPGRVTAHWKA